MVPEEDGSSRDDESAMRRIGVLLFDGVRTLDFIGPAEVFAVSGQEIPGYELLFLSPDGAPVTTSVGLQVAVDAAAGGIGDLDTLIVPGSDSAAGKADDGFQAARAELGTRSRRVRSSTGVTPGIDLALALIEEDHGPRAARTAARLLLICMRRGGEKSQFSASSGAVARRLAPRTSVVRSLADYVGADPTRPCTLRDLAAHANVSTRHLTRVVRDELNMTPIEYVNSMRLDLALGLLESGHAVRAVAESTGYSSPVALRRAFTARFNTTPSEYQRAFRTDVPTAAVGVRGSDRSDRRLRA